jgi:hypothetical protein
MMTKKWVKRSLAFVALVSTAGMFSVGCGGGADLPVDNSKDGGNDKSDVSVGHDGGGIITFPDATPRPDNYFPPEAGGRCDGPPVTKCQNPAGNYCGVIGDGCGGTQDCGGCPTGQSCLENICRVPTDGCTPLTCLQLLRSNRRWLRASARLRNVHRRFELRRRWHPQRLRRGR